MNNIVGARPLNLSQPGVRRCKRKTLGRAPQVAAMGRLALIADKLGQRATCPAPRTPHSNSLHPAGGGHGAAGAHSR
jgi:hypothetical protein